MSTSAPDGVHVDDAQPLVVVIVEVAFRFRKQHSSNQSTPDDSVWLSNFRKFADPAEHSRDLDRKQVLRVSMRPPPVIFGLETALRFFK